MTKSEAERLFNHIISQGIWEDEKPEETTDEHLFEKAVNVSAKIMKISPKIVLDKSRFREGVLARQLCYRYLISKGVSTRNMAKMFNRTHGSVSVAMKRIRGFEDIKDPKTMRMITDFENLIN